MVEGGSRKGFPFRQVQARIQLLGFKITQTFQGIVFGNSKPYTPKNSKSPKQLQPQTLPLRSFRVSRPRKGSKS